MSFQSVYLTIDDSPSKDFKNKVQFLMKNKIPALFFCIGQQIPGASEELKYAIEHGYHIGNHSYSHKHFSSLSLKACLEDINKADKLIADLYQSCGIKSYPKVFRFPFGDKGDYKFGFNLYPFDQIYEIKLGRKKRLAYKMLKPLAFYSHKKEKGMVRANKVQEHLKSLGYTPPSINIDHPFYEKFKRDRDWMWTLDLEDYKLMNNEDLNNALQNTYALLETKRPNAGYTPSFKEKETSNLSSNILLTHDYENNGELFYHTIEYMLQSGYIFKKPLKK
ncbi:polysaccharide deacetylase family protein [Fulvivirga maritima]|uniref:polysaccharide deacetylase family protein n=1 Tax=Fulvivirga maritima TaxID=2904247 RepID=UPI001F3C0851|nr:polysaccharide deacetylase family protein [Fulvivirga maritima]UII25419.1 polysaccharide deacetylase family protein [Fulvivirga maritima]